MRHSNAAMAVDHTGLRSRLPLARIFIRLRTVISFTARLLLAEQLVAQHRGMLIRWWLVKLPLVLDWPPRFVGTMHERGPRPQRNWSDVWLTPRSTSSSSARGRAATSRRSARRSSGSRPPSSSATISAASAPTGAASRPRRCCGRRRCSIYLQHAKDYGLSAENVTFDPAAVIKRSRGVAKRLADGVAFLLKKNKGHGDLGRGRDRRARQDHREDVENAGAQGCARAGFVLGQAHHHRDRRAAARAAGARAGQETGLDVFRSDDAGPHAEVAAGDRFGRDRDRVRVVLPHARRRGDGGGNPAADSSGRRRRDRRVRAQGVREARHQDSDRREGDQARQEVRQRHRDDRRRQGRDADDHGRIA